MIESAFTQRTPAIVKAIHADRPEAARPAISNEGHAAPRSAGPAFVVSLSKPTQEQAEHLAAVSDLSAAMTKASVAARAKLDELTGPKAKIWQNAFEEMGKLKSEQVDDRMNYSLINAHKQILDDSEKSYVRVLNTKPVAPVEMKGKEYDAAFDLAMKKKLPVGAYDNVSFTEGDYTYTFYKDGTATKNKWKIPTSEEHKERWLEALKSSIEIGKSDISPYEERIIGRNARIAEFELVMKANAIPL